MNVSCKYNLMLILKMTRIFQAFIVRKDVLLKRIGRWNKMECIMRIGIYVLHILLHKSYTYCECPIQDINVFPHNLIIM